MADALINGKSYDLIVLRVLEKDGFNRPLRAVFVYDHDVVDLADGQPNEFITAFALTSVLAPQISGSA